MSSAEGEESAGAVTRSADAGGRGAPASGSASLIEVRGLCRSFESEAGSVEVLKGLDLDIQEADRVAIVGQ